MKALLRKHEERDPFGIPEVETVIAERSTSVNRCFGVRRVMRLFERSRSSVYCVRSQDDVISGPQHKRGPKTEYTDAELTEQIRALLGVTPFVGEGRRTRWALVCGSRACARRSNTRCG